MPVSERRIHQLFEISVFVKGFYAILECAAGLGLAFITPNTIINWITWLTQDEFALEPHNYITTFLLHFGESFSITTKNFYVFYLLGHGLVKLLLVVGLLKRKMGAYPLSLVLVALFVIYQLYRFSFTHSVGLVILTALDLIFIALVWHEYQRARRHFPLDPMPPKEREIQKTI